MRLPDILPPRPRILFIGINPGLRSGATGHHFAGKGNPFWKLLFVTGLTPVQLTPEADVRLPEFGLALTNVCPRPTRTAAELTAEEFRRGAKRLRRVIAATEPRWVAFVGLSIYQQFFARKASGGAGEKPERLGAAWVFALPNPSGLNAAFPGFEAKRVWFAALAEAAERQPS